MRATFVHGRRSPSRSTGRRIASSGSAEPVADDAGRGQRSQRLVVVVFLVLVFGFAVGIWGTVLRPTAYEVRGILVARPAANLILVRHEEIPALGMRAMDLMTILADPVLVDRAGVVPGERVRLAVRPQGHELTVVWLEKVP